MKLTMPVPVATLNEYINAERKNRYAAAKIKKQETFAAAVAVGNAMKQGVAFDWPCALKFTWHVKNRKKDPDNISFSKKFILDGMQKAGFLPNDSMKYITGFVDVFIADGKSIVEIEPIDLGGCDESNADETDAQKVP